MLNFVMLWVPPPPIHTQNAERPFQSSQYKVNIQATDHASVLLKLILE
jgi:hypothetical protein